MKLVVTEVQSVPPRLFSAFAVALVPFVSRSVLLVGRDLFAVVASVLLTIAPILHFVLLAQDEPEGFECQ